jgi:hypothetical protein
MKSWVILSSIPKKDKSGQYDWPKNFYNTKTAHLGGFLHYCPHFIGITLYFIQHAGWSLFLLVRPGLLFSQTSAGFSASGNQAQCSYKCGIPAITETFPDHAPALPPLSGTHNGEQSKLLPGQIPNP